MKNIIKIFCIFLTLLFVGTSVYAEQWKVVDKASIEQIDGHKVGKYYFILDDKHDKNYKSGLMYSEDGYKFNLLEGVRTNAIPIYSNGLYFVIDNSDENVPINKRYIGFNNAPSYILDQNLKLIKILEEKCYISYIGYYNGYHYIDFSYYVSNSDQNSWESTETGQLYKTENGIEMIPVNIDKEDLSFLYGICLDDNNIIKQSFGRDDKAKIECFMKNKKYDVLFEKDGFLSYYYGYKRIPLLVMYYKVGEEVVDWIYDRKAIQSIEKKYLSLDGIYGIEMPEDIGNYRFEADGNFYFDRDEKTYYCIAKELLENKIKVIYKDKILAFEVAPTTESDRTLVPMRFLFEQMGAKVGWQNDTRTAIVEKNGEEIAFSIDNTTAKVNNVMKTMDVPARLVNNKTMIPLRFLSEELGYKVDWDEDTKTVTISE